MILRLRPSLRSRLRSGLRPSLRSRLRSGLRPSLRSRLRAPRSGALRQRGFTLLEVMVALGILAGAMMVTSDIVSGALRNHGRARSLEVATLLARGKLAALEDHYEEKGFKTSDESEEGTFEDEGHPEVRWRVAVSMPAVELGADQVIALLTGMEGGLQELVPPEQAPRLAAYAAALPALATQFGEDLKRGVREVSLTVAWLENGREEGFTVRTHMVVLNPAQGVAR